MMILYSSQGQIADRAFGIRAGTGFYETFNNFFHPDVNSPFYYQNSLELSFQWSRNDTNRIQIDAGSQWTDSFRTIMATSSYQWVFSSKKGFAFFIGPEASIGIHEYYRDSTHIVKFYASALGLCGVQYEFRGVPVQVSFDIRPHIELLPYTGFSVMYALAVRYTID